jgi:hypothetical protein
MASSFNTGFRLGNDMFNQARRNSLAQEELAMAKEREAREKERDARAAETHQQAMQESGLRLGALRRVDDATTALTNAQTLGIGLPDNQAANADMQRSAFRRSEIGEQNYGDDAPAYQAPTGLQPAYRKASDLDMNSLQSTLAAARGDVAGMEALRGARKDIEWTDGYGAKLKEYNGSPEQIGATLTHLNQNSRSVTMGKPDKDGFVQLSVVKPDGEAAFARLTKQDQAKLYAASSLMELNPQRAFDLMAQVNKDLATAIAAENNLNIEVAKGGNDLAYKQGSLANQGREADVKDQQLGISREKLDLDKKELDIKRGQANAAAQYYRDRTNAERMGAAQYFTGQDGNTYAAVPKMGPKGLTFETVQVNPNGVKMTRVGGAGTDTKPVDVKEEGAKVTIGGRLMFADGNGGFIPGGANGKPVGVLPSERLATLKKAGVPDNVIGQLQWNAEGTAVGLNGMRFDLSELKNIKTEYERMGRNSVAVDEANKSSMVMHGALNRMRNPPPEAKPTSSPWAFGPKITYQRDPNAPSIYASPEAWAEYRWFQQMQQQQKQK